MKISKEIKDDIKYTEQLHKAFKEIVKAKNDADAERIDREIMSEIEKGIEPCKECGVVAETFMRMLSPNLYICWCTTCNIKTSWYSTEAEAIEAWNEMQRGENGNED